MTSGTGLSKITFIPPGKLRCVITDRLRDDTPEEHVASARGTQSG